MIAAMIMAGAPALAAPPGIPKEGFGVFLVVLVDSAGSGQGKSPSVPDVTRMGGVEHERRGGAIVVTLPLHALAQMEAHSGVEYVQRVWMGESLDGWNEGRGRSRTPKTDSGREAIAASWDSQLYAYDGSGNIKSIGNDQYVYDSAARVISATVDTVVETYSYDSFGNLRANSTADRPSRIPAVDSTTNRLAEAQYDVAGNMLSVIPWRYPRYAYDSMGMLSVVQPESSSAARRMIYTADDERLAFRLDGSMADAKISIRGFDGKVLREFRGALEGSPWLWVEDYVYGEGRLLAAQREEAKGGRLHFHTDHLGSVRLITKADRTKLSEHRYFPFGSERTNSSYEVTNFRYVNPPRIEPMKFTSHERDYFGPMNVDSTDHLDYMHARYYNPNLGRFLSVDPVMDVEKNVAEPQRWNRYAYVTNNPLKYDDPDGREKRIMVLSVVEDGPRFRVNPILNQDTHYGTDSGYDVQVQHGLGAKSLLHALSKVDGTGTDIPVIVSHGVPLQTETGGGPTGSRRVNFGAAEIGAALDGKKAQAIILAACGSMGVAQGVANRTNTIVFGITAGVTVSSRQVGRSGAVLADIYAKTGNAAFAIAMANRTLTRRGCTPGGQCDPRPQWHYVEPEKK